MLIGIDNILKWLDTNKTPYWQLRSGAGEKANVLYSARPDEDNSTMALVDSREKLLDCLNSLGAGNYSIEAWVTPGAKKNWFKTPFQITSGQAGAQPQFAGMYGHNAPQAVQDVPKLIEEALERERTKNKVAELERLLSERDKRIKELEAEVDSTEHRVGNKLTQVFDIIEAATNGGGGNKAATVSGNSDEEKVANLMERWAAKDENFINALAGIVGLVENNPSKYEMAKKFL